jgi:hypothetical protein
MTPLLMRFMARCWGPLATPAPQYRNQESQMFITENYYDPEAHENRLTELFELSCSADGFERENKFVDLAPVAKRRF